MKTSAEEAGIGVMALLAAFIILVIANISLVRSLRYVLSARDGRRKRTKQMARISTERLIIAIVALAALSYTWSYLKNVRLRSVVTPADCNSEQSADGHYIARYCYIGSAIVLRLYDETGAQLLVERTYRDTSGVPVKLYWKKSALLYPEDRGLGAISLPPSLYDQMVAKLP
jgi:hypothetical protein